MADKIIQIKNDDGDKLYPLTDVSAVEGLDGEYSKDTHTHTFTGSAKAVNVTGTYSRATGINNITYTPAGQVSQPSFSGTVNLGANTTSTGGVKYLEDVSYTAPTATKGNYTPAGNVSATFTGNATTSLVTNVTGGGASGTTSYLHYSNPSLTTTQIYQITGVGSNPSLTTSTTNAGSDIVYVENVSHTAASASGTANGLTGVSYTSAKASGTAQFVNNVTVNGTGSLTATLSNGILIISHTDTNTVSAPKANAVTGITAGSVTTTSRSFVTGVNGGGISQTRKYLRFNAGSVPTRATVNVGTGLSGGSLTSNTTSSGGIKYVTQVNSNSLSVTKGSYTPSGSVNASFAGTTTSSLVTGISGGSVGETAKYFHPSVSGTVTRPTFTGTQATISATLTTSSTTISSTGTYTPSGTIGAAND